MRDWRERAPQRAKVLDFVVAEVAAGRPFPTSGQIAVRMGWNRPASAIDALHALVALGALGKYYSGKTLVFHMPDQPPQQTLREVF